VNAPLFTIVTPCLNSAKTISATIASVLSQTYQDFEYLIIDGESNDGTWDIIRRFQQDDQRIRAIRRRDGSMTEALVQGFSCARGRILASLNADDRYRENTLQQVQQAWSHGGFRCLIGNTLCETPQGLALFRIRPWLAGFAWSWHIFGCMTPECSVFFDHSSYIASGGFDRQFRYSQDYDLYLRLSRRYRIRHLDSMLSCFLMHDGQLSSRAWTSLEQEVAQYYPCAALRRLLVSSAVGSLLPVLCGMRRYTPRQWQLLFGRRLGRFFRR
jgi:glycosyltransferase involved in cell wall biosynthesis